MMFKSDDAELAKLLDMMAKEKQAMCKTKFSDESLAAKLGVSDNSICRWYRDYSQKTPLPPQPPLPPIEKPVPKSCGMIELDYKGVKFTVRLDQLKTVLKEIAD